MSVARLRTVVTLEEDLPERASVACQLFAVLEDGTECLLLADRGFSWRSSSEVGHWFGVTADYLEDDARTCVGPDEPRDGQSRAQASHVHWSGLADALRLLRGVTMTATQLGQAPHDVVLDDAISKRLADDA